MSRAFMETSWSDVPAATRRIVPVPFREQRVDR